MADNEIAEFFTTTVSKDFLDLFAGKRIGSGIARTVYECNLDKTLVVKVEMRAQNFQNVQEWENWRWLKDVKKVASWLAPCVAISPCGIVLLQKRTKPVEKDELPKLIPKFLTDTKVGNFGKLNGKIVCHDYAQIITSTPLNNRKIEWWT